MKTGLFCLAVVLLGLPGPALAQDVKGLLRWSHPMEYQESPTVLHEGLLYHGITALDPATGKLRKTFYSENMGQKIAAIRFVRGVVIFASESVANAEESDRSWDYHWDAFDLKTGRLLWEAYQNCKHPADAFLETCDQGLALLVKGEAHDQLTAMDPRTGKSLWVHSGMPIQDLIAAPDRIFLQNRKMAVALSPAQGTVLWKTALPGERRVSFALGSQLLVIPRKLEDEGSCLIALHRDQGKILWKKIFPKADLFPPTIWDDTLYVVSQPEDEDSHPGRLLALALPDGKEKWTLEIVVDYNGHAFQPVIFNRELLIWSGNRDYLVNYGSSGAIRLLSLDFMTGKPAWSYLPRKKEKFIYSRPLPCGKDLVYDDYEDLNCIRLETDPGQLKN
jgi:outer membrane protein assembly factor BamB